MVASDDAIADHRRYRFRTLVDDFLLDVLRGHDVGLFALDTEVAVVLIRRRDVRHAVHEGAEVLFVASGGQAHRAVGHAVIRATAGDDLVASRESAHRLNLLGDLERGFNGFRSAG